MVQDHEADVFIHSWSVDVKNKLLQTYAPVDYIIEDEKIFDDNFKPEYRYLDHRKNQKNKWGPNHRLCMLYSVHKTLELKRQYEEKNNFKYDVVFLLRYDLDFIKYFHYNDYNSSLLYTSPMPKGSTLRRGEVYTL